ncbi:MAG: hypothetical protein IPI67_06315 [Myxococcales bacterium]|nr:hypothetical protein [Myxococcales bacterium]
MTSVFLYAPQDFRNLCVLARTLEVFGHRECHVFDPRRLVRERYGKSRAREMRVVSAGAFAKIQWHRVDDPGQFLGNYSGRVVATVAQSGATPLTQFRFALNDLLVFGPESHGLPPAVVADAQTSLTVESQGKTQSLNLAVCLGIVLFEAHRQLHGTRD